jgi:hypothetical protein
VDPTERTADDGQREGLSAGAVTVTARGAG